MNVLKITIGLGLGALALAAAALFALPAVVQAQSATPTPAPDGATRPGRGEGFGPRGHHGLGRHGQGSFIEAAASVTGLTTDEVRTQLQSGQSLAQIAEAEGKTGADVIAAARALLEDRLAQAVTDGRLTQAEADAILQQFDEGADAIVNDATLGQGRGFGPKPDGAGRLGRGRSAANALLNAAASVTGLTTDEVRTQLQSGQSLAQIVEAEDQTVADVIAAARALLEEQYAQAVTDGGLTQAEADAKLQQFDETAEQIMNDAALGQGRHGCLNNAPNPAPATPDNTVQPLQAAPGGEA